jgi:hypothetical protein
MSILREGENENMFSQRENISCVWSLTQARRQASMRTKDLTDQITVTYKVLRIALAVIAFAFPLLLWIGGYLVGKLPLAGSMSAYYHASDFLYPEQGPSGQGVMRNEFVGLLFAVGALLFAYQGYSWLEDYALNLAGFLALGIALFPMQWAGESNNSSFSIHGACAILFFLCIAYVCIWRAADTLSLIGNAPTRERYRRTYQILGWAMVICPLSAWLLISWMPFRKSAIFFTEAAGIYVFATYWVVKTIEASKTNLDKRASLGRLRAKPHGVSDLFRPLPVTPVGDPLREP